RRFRTPVARHPVVTRHREVLDGADVGHPWQRAKALEYLIVVGESRCQGEALRRGLQAEGEQALRIESGVDALEMPQRAEHETGADAKHDSQRDLCSDQRAEHCTPLRSLAVLLLAE